MAKYKIEIEIDVDFDKIFSEIPDGLFKNDDGGGSDEHYEKECISDVLKDGQLAALERQMKNRFGRPEMSLYLKHHDECSVEVSKQMWKNAKIKKID